MMPSHRLTSMDSVVVLRGPFFNVDEVPGCTTNDLPADDSLDCEEDAVGKEAKSASIEPLVGHPRSIVAH